jgi:hypothetical protein
MNKKSSQARPPSLHSGVSGQALVVLLFYMIIAITLTTTAVAVIVSNSLSITQEEQGSRALEVAEGGAENSLLRLMRDTNYAGETITLDDGSATSTVSGTMTKTIVSTGKIGNVTRVVQVIVSTTNGVMTVTSWQEP